MLKQSQIEGLAQKTLVLQIIAGSLIMGVVVATVLLLVITDMSESGFDMGLLTMLGCVALFVSIVMSFFVPTLVANAGIVAAKEKTSKDTENDGTDFGKQSGDSNVDSLANVFQTKTIIRFALIEGACFLNAILILLEKSWVSPIAIAVGILVMLLFFPTRDRMVQFIEQC